MGTADGAVLGSTRVVDHGPDAERWTLVVLSEGYRKEELPVFKADTEAFLGSLFAAEPFGALWPAINVHRVDVRSDESGADEPAACGDGSTGSGAAPRTYFDATFCVASTARLLAGDQVLALKTAAAAVPEVDATVVIVNSTRYGGAGGSTAWFSRHADAGEIGIHELGHSAFRLMDEYGDIHGTWTGAEPTAPNITGVVDRATTKWASRIAATTPLPTTKNPDCTKDDLSPSPVPARTVGLFEGGGRAFCGLYRAEHDCRMRTLGRPFCAVCRDAITRVLRPHLPKAAAAPRLGVQFSAALQPGQSRRWYTHGWPVGWHVLWSVVPVSAAAPDPGVRWQVRTERAGRERLTYWIDITNGSSSAVDVEARYAVLTG